MAEIRAIRTACRRQTGAELETAFSEFVPGRKVSYPFYTEALSFELAEKNGGTQLDI